MIYEQAPIDIQDFFKWSWVQCPSYGNFQKKLKPDYPISTWLNGSFRWDDTEDRHDKWSDIDGFVGDNQINAIRETKFYAEFLKTYVPPKPFDEQAIIDMRQSLEKLFVR